MEKRPTIDYIWIGGSYRYLRDAGTNHLVHQEGHVLANVRNLRASLESVNLPVSARAMGTSGLEALADELEAIDDENATLSDGHVSRLQTAMDHVWTSISAEAMGVFAFVVSDKRVGTADALLDQPEKLLAPDVFDALPGIAQYDFRQAARCIAFEQATAAAFHLMRATEAVLKEFYLRTVRRGRVKLMWGPMVEHLRKRRTPPPAPLLNHLDNLRENFRNPTQHPDATYDIHDVQDLMNVCVDVLNRMHKA